MAGAASVQAPLVPLSVATPISGAPLPFIAPVAITSISSASRDGQNPPAGHVCTAMGTAAHVPIAQRYRVPIVVTGFEPLDILQGVLLCIRQLEAGRAEVENQYARVVRQHGNPAAQRLIAEVFEQAPQLWRGLGEIPASGMRLRAAYAHRDAFLRLGGAPPAIEASSSPCMAGAVLRGVAKPPECPAFGGDCTPEHPLGAPMVSGEGACAVYHRYRAAAE